jgi:hypothetical protein
MKTFLCYGTVERASKHLRFYELGNLAHCHGRGRSQSTAVVTRKYFSRQ